MVTFSTLGTSGRWGNQLFQLCACAGLAKTYNTTWAIPKWKYSYLFNYRFPEKDPLPTPDLVLKEPHYKYDQEYFDRFDWQNKVIDIQGYFQNVKYFDQTSAKDLLTLKPEITEPIREKYKHLFSKPTIGIHCRRGDYVGNPNYVQLPIRYFLLALLKFEYHKYNIILFSDDLMHVWFHFKCLPNAFFPKFESDIESFIVGTMMDNWILSNSTFGWWQAYLSNATRVIQPNYLFAGELLEREGPQNFYIENERFEIFDHNQ